MKETLDLLNLEVTVEPDLLHGYGEIPSSGSRSRSRLVNFGQGSLGTPTETFPGWSSSWELFRLEAMIEGQ